MPDAQRREETSELDARLLATPALALGQARNVAGEMAACAVRALENALTSLTGYTPELARSSGRTRSAATTMRTSSAPIWCS